MGIWIFYIFDSIKIWALQSGSYEWKIIRTENTYFNDFIIKLSEETWLELRIQKIGFIFMIGSRGK